MAKAILDLLARIGTVVRRLLHLAAVEFSIGGLLAVRSVLVRSADRHHGLSWTKLTDGVQLAFTALPPNRARD